MASKVNKILIVSEIIVLAVVVAGIYLLYPRTNVNVSGNFVNFNSINAKVIELSENPDFSNPRYLDFSQVKNTSLKLKPGKYYWKADNGIIEGISNEFEIKSEVSMEINRSENESNLVNVGNVKINVTKGEGGVMVGHIILEPEESQKIEDKGNYSGKQE